LGEGEDIAIAAVHRREGGREGGREMVAGGMPRCVCVCG